MGTQHTAETSLDESFPAGSLEQQSIPTSPLSRLREQRQLMTTIVVIRTRGKPGLSLLQQRNHMSLSMQRPPTEPHSRPNRFRNARSRDLVTKQPGRMFRTIGQQPIIETSRSIRWNHATSPRWLHSGPIHPSSRETPHITGTSRPMACARWCKCLPFRPKTASQRRFGTGHTRIWAGITCFTMWPRGITSETFRRIIQFR
mmetsp:Transcript_21389/g.50276  ORF Transcript_21389/g.50276 Transcript_21389/m.50276 type:complete len:201 (-) Transcript_21389:83-685(-)